MYFMNCLFRLSICSKKGSKQTKTTSNYIHSNHASGKRKKQVAKGKQTKKSKRNMSQLLFVPSLFWWKTACFFGRKPWRARVIFSFPGVPVPSRSWARRPPQSRGRWPHGNLRVHPSTPTPQQNKVVIHGYSLLLMVQKSQTTTWDVFTTRRK